MPRATRGYRDYKLRVAGIREVPGGNAPAHNSVNLLGAILLGEHNLALYFDVEISDPTGSPQIAVRQIDDFNNRSQATSLAPITPGLFGSLGAVEAVFVASVDDGNHIACLEKAFTYPMFLRAQVKSQQWCTIDEP